MFIPIGDNNPRERTPYVNYGLLGLNILVFLFHHLRSTDEFIEITNTYALVPAAWTPLTLVTSIFLHADFWHLAGNMLFLWIFGDNVEDILGRVRYLIFYLACGFLATFAHMAAPGDPNIPILGASGAISGVIGAYVIFFPHCRIKLLVWLFIFIQIFLIPAWVFVGVWVALQVYSAAQGQPGVAWFAHLGGIAAGASVAGIARLWFRRHRPHARLRAEIQESSGVEPTRRGPFVPVADDFGMEFIDEDVDRYAVLRLVDESADASGVAEAVSHVTGEPTEAVDRRIAKSRGMIARGIPREQARQLQAQLTTRNVASAMIHDVRSNHPPHPQQVEFVSWNDQLLRLRMGDQIVPVPWSAPFLHVAASVRGTPAVEIFVDRRTAFRIPEGARLVEVDAHRRSESPAVPSDLGRAILKYLGTATADEGIRRLAEGAGWDRLSFSSPVEYDDYLFWIYNLAIERARRQKA